MADAILAHSGFNIPPFTAGIPVHGQGGSEAGWASPWEKLGGFEDRGHVVTSPTQEGNGAVQLFADLVFGTSVERKWEQIVPAVRVDAFIYVTPGAAMQGQIVNSQPFGEVFPRAAAAFRIENSGSISIYDTDVDNFVSSGFHTIPNQWNKYSLVVDLNKNTYKFLFNDQLFQSTQPLGLVYPTFYVNGINYMALETRTSYVDNVTVTAVPEQPSFYLAAASLMMVGIVGWRRKTRLNSVRNSTVAALTSG